MVDLVQQLREVKQKKFSPESLQAMVLWGADEIERLRSSKISTISAATVRVRKITAGRSTMTPTSTIAIMINMGQTIDR